MLELQGVSYAYPASSNAQSLLVISALEGTFLPGQISVVLGPSGCGKTTLLNLIAGVIKPSEGHIQYPKGDSKYRHRVGYVFQSPSLVPWRTIRENALFGAEITGIKTAETESRCSYLLRTYGLGGFEDAYPGALSGGMQQRVSIVRAVLSGAKIILLDEPFSNSDFIMRRELQREISRLVSEEQLIAVLVTHDIEEAVRIGDKVVVLTPRPARVSTEIDIPIPRDARLNGGARSIEVLAPYLERVEGVFVAGNQPESATEQGIQ